MRILHTSDWHLGRSFHRVGMLEHQAAFVDHLVETVRSEHVDVVIVAGDVYDRALPSVDTVALLDDALTRISDAGAQLVLSSGNHDSAERLGFGGAVLERGGVHLRTRVRDLHRPVLVDDEHGQVAVYALPFLEPALVAGALGAERTHASVLGAAMERVRSDAKARGGRSVVAAHAFVVGGHECESERDISVGGVDSVPASVFAGVDYAALGHLHGRQQISDAVRYSGSPIAYSFGEVAHHKGSWLVDLDRRGLASVTAVEAPVPRPLAVLRGDLEDLLSDPRHRAAERAWCQVTLTDGARPQGAMDRVRARFPHALVLAFDPQGVVTDRRTYAQRVSGRAPVDVCCDFVSHVRQTPTAASSDRALLSQALEGARLSGTESAAIESPATRRGREAGAA